MEKFNQTELKAARKILKELLKKGPFFWYDKQVAKVTIKAMDLLIINSYDTGSLKFSSLPRTSRTLPAQSLSPAVTTTSNSVMTIFSASRQGRIWTT